MKNTLSFIFLFFLNIIVSYSQNERFVVKEPSANFFLYHFEKEKCIINTNFNEIPESIFNRTFIITFDSSRSVLITENSDEYKDINYKNQKYSYNIQYICNITSKKSNQRRIQCYASLTFVQSRLDYKQEKVLSKYKQFIEEEDSIRFMFRDILQKEYEKYLLQKFKIDMNIKNHLCNAKKIIVCEEQYSLKDTFTLNTKYNSIKIRNGSIIDTLEETVCVDLISIITNKSNLYSPIYVDCFIPNYMLIFIDDTDHVIAIINLQIEEKECTGYDYEVYLANDFLLEGSANIVNGKDYINLLFSNIIHK